MARGFRLPRGIILPGKDGVVNYWVLTPTGVSTLNSLHTWDKGNPDNEETLKWNDDWYWTENDKS